MPSATCRISGKPTRTPRQNVNMKRSKRLTKPCFPMRSRAWSRIVRRCYILRFSHRVLAQHSQHQPHRVNLGHDLASRPPSDGLRISPKRVTYDGQISLRRGVSLATSTWFLVIGGSRRGHQAQRPDHIRNKGGNSTAVNTESSIRNAAQTPLLATPR